MVDRNKHKIDVEKLKEKFDLDINNYFNKEKCSLDDFDINDFLKGENKHYSMFIIKEEIRMDKDYDALFIPFKINNQITEIGIKKLNHQHMF